MRSGRTTMSEINWYLMDGSVRMPAGAYYVGDPCYSITDHGEWMEWLEAARYETSHVLIADHRGKPVLGLATAYGDGCYEDQESNQYLVDAGLIGLVPVEVADAPGGRCVYFKESFLCSRTSDGTLTFGDIIIETGD
jgi:hypothetical protein